MIRKCTDEDISDEELEKVINPFYDNYHEFVITYIMPETIAFYIASSYSRNVMWEATFFQHYNSAKDMFNINDNDYNKVKREVIKLLRIKYSLEIVSEDHDFKHSCASLLINNGANVTLVAKYLGHTKIEENLNTYSHMFSTALDSVVSVIDSLEEK